MVTGGKLNIQAINQVGIVVRDLDKAMERYWEEFGIGPWAVFSFGPGIKKTTYRGEPCSFELKIAMAQVGPLMLELLQPVSGTTPHQEFLDQHGEGLQHVGVFVERIDEAVEQVRQLGYQEISAAYGITSSGEGAGVYFDTLGALGTLLELIEMPSQMPPPERVYPTPSV